MFFVIFEHCFKTGMLGTLSNKFTISNDDFFTTSAAYFFKQFFQKIKNVKMFFKSSTKNDFERCKSKTSFSYLGKFVLLAIAYFLYKSCMVMMLARKQEKLDRRNLKKKIKKNKSKNFKILKTNL